MRLRLAVPWLLLLPVLSACGPAADTAGEARDVAPRASEVAERAGDVADRADDCAAVAREMAAVGLGQLPNREQVEQAAQQLDERVQQMDNPEVAEAAGMLRDRLRELAEAAGQANPMDIAPALQEVREAAERTADVCGLPVDQLLR